METINNIVCINIEPNQKLSPTIIVNRMVYVLIGQDERSACYAPMTGRRRKKKKSTPAPPPILQRICRGDFSFTPTIICEEPPQFLSVSFTLDGNEIFNFSAASCGLLGSYANFLCNATEEEIIAILLSSLGPAYIGRITFEVIRTESPLSFTITVIITDEVSTPPPVTLTGDAEEPTGGFPPCNNIGAGDIPLSCEIS